MPVHCLKNSLVEELFTIVDATETNSYIQFYYQLLLKSMF